MTALFEDNFDIHDPVEVHWSSSTILAIFFAASLVSAVFFGLGYSFGGAGASKHSFALNTAPATTATPAVPSPKPTPLAASNQPSLLANVADRGDAHPAVAASSTPPVALHPVAMTTIAHAATPVVEKKSVPPPVIRHDNAPVAEKGSVHIMVQVGAIGDRKDAERLVAELRQKGFHAGIYQVKTDKFLHVQLGPFNDAAQAQSKRHQVMASGFHAILKSS
jgi:cell division protein FtsN